MVKQVRAYRRPMRKQQVIKQLCIWRQNGYATQASAYRLAKALDMRGVANLLSILYEMVEDGDLEKVFVSKPGRWDGYEFLLTEKHLITEKFSCRHISVKSRGVAVGQLEMFS